MTPTQNKIVHGILAKRGLMDMKESIVRQFTQGRTSSSADMTDEEAKHLINNFNNVSPAVKPIVNDALDKKRKQLFAMGYSIGEQPAFVKNWCETMGVGNDKRKFNDYSHSELIALVAKFKKVVEHRVGKIRDV
jgi:hypothetical protein